MEGDRIDSPSLREGSMKWFMPPMPRILSRTQADTHEPSTVTSIRSSVVT